MKKVKWRSINSQNIPVGSGVYAWYYELNISEFDINNLLKKIENCSEVNEQKEEITKFVQTYIFSYFQETPYEAKISGKLKATYIGTLQHKQEISENLTAKLLEKPELLHEIKDTLSNTDSAFMSPLYIGMAQNLLTRLQKHKSLIERYRSDGVSHDFKSEKYDEIRDHNFAARIISRNFNETNLYVLFKDVDEDFSLHNMLENVLNRINYPILGRN